MAALDAIDDKKKRHEGALNALESFILNTRIHLETEEYIAAGSESERESLNSALNKGADWLDEFGFTADTDELEKQLKTLVDGAKALLKRVDEHRNRPEALGGLEKGLEGSKKFLAMAENQTKSVPEDERVFTEIEITTLKKTIKDTEVYFIFTGFEHRSLRVLF
jgi:hypoxia up-regulated 1